MQEGQLIERDAQIQAQNADIRALRRQHAMDAEGLRTAHGEMAPKARPAGSPTSRAPRAPQTSPSKGTPVHASLRKQLQQALHDKVVLVRALHQMTSEMAQARAEARQHKAASERSMATAWRLGQLGQLGLALLEMGEEEEDAADAASVSADGSSTLSVPGQPPLGPRWEQLLEATHETPPMSEASPPLAPRVDGRQYLDIGELASD